MLYSDVWQYRVTFCATALRWLYEPMDHRPVWGNPSACSGTHLGSSTVCWPVDEVRSVLWLRSCPRCQGALYEEVDTYGHYISCLNCGHHLSRYEEERLRVRTAVMVRSSLTPMTARVTRVSHSPAFQNSASTCRNGRGRKRATRFAGR